MSAKNLVIVESPAKAKTIQGYLGKNYMVLSSFGHIRDLPSKTMAVAIEHDFAPQYQVSPEKKKTVAQLKKALGADTIVWLATDEDREGEAIAWHLAEVLKLKPDNTKRIVFHEITKTAIQAAVESPRTLDMHLVDAQQARRVLDRLVGYELSPVLWRKVRPGLSAGRVQSVAVRLIVEREREIQAHQASTTFKLTADLNAPDGTTITATSTTAYDTAEAARTAMASFKSAAPKISDISDTDGTRNPGPPFTTSTLQQEASQRLGYSVKQTMRLAQKLYEAGAITYMRTDSVALSKQSLAAATDYISGTYGKEYHQFRTYSTKSKGAQEAHEAIRPSDVTRESAGDEPKTQKLYQLIRGRFLASQMASVKLKRTTIAIEFGSELLEAKGEVITFAGWLKAHPNSSLKDKQLPSLKTSDQLIFIAATAQETPSRPPARYSEAMLVKKLEEMGIGRPSTYAPTISTIQDRGYIERGPAPEKEIDLITISLKNNMMAEITEQTTIGGEKRKLIPTDTATVVSDFLVKHFAHIVDYDFTAGVETEFDKIADGEERWNRMIADFYQAFHKSVEAALDVSRQEASQARELGLDPKTKQPIVARYGRYGAMLQRGKTDDDEKPTFAPLPKGATIETVTLDQAMKMFELPRVLGQDGGADIKANIGRFGPYVQKDKTYASIPKDEDVFSITLERALQLINDRQQAAQKQLLADLGKGIQIKDGRFGPYITDGKTNVKVPKGTDPKAISLADAQDFIKKKARA